MKKQKVIIEGKDSRNHLNIKIEFTLNYKFPAEEYCGGTPEEVFGTKIAQLLLDNGFHAKNIKTK